VSLLSRLQLDQYTRHRPQLVGRGKQGKRQEKWGADYQTLIEGEDCFKKKDLMKKVQTRKWMGECRNDDSCDAMITFGDVSKVETE
jgi:hypothetical protein